ncbi:MAG: hypothetical protein RLZZ73_996, partial [Actinomycetota bacterium]
LSALRNRSIATLIGTKGYSGDSPIAPGGDLIQGQSLTLSDGA